MHLEVAGVRVAFREAVVVLKGVAVVTKGAEVVASRVSRVVRVVTVLGGSSRARGVNNLLLKVLPLVVPGLGQVKAR